MSQSLKSLVIVTAIVGAWAGSSALFGRIFGIVLPCMSLAVFLAGVMLLAASNNENSWRRLTWQPYQEEISSGLLLVFLVLTPITILFGVFLASLGTLFFRWLDLLAFNFPI